MNICTTEQFSILLQNAQSNREGRRFVDVEVFHPCCGLLGFTLRNGKNRTPRAIRMAVRGSQRPFSPHYLALSS